MSGAGTVKGDILFPSWFVEAKNTSRASPLQWLMKAHAQAGGRKAYIAWNPGDSRNAVAIMWLSDLEELLEASSGRKGLSVETADLIEALKALIASYEG